MKRRDFITSLLAGGSVAIAAQFKVTQAVAAEIEEELVKDLKRGPMVAMPGDPEGAVWYSVANVAQVWAEQLKPQLRHMVGPEHLERAQDKLPGMCKKLARAIDFDLSKAQVGDTAKVLVEIPKLRKSGAGRLMEHVELVGGLDSRSTIFGDRFRVGYIQENIIV